MNAKTLAKLKRNPHYKISPKQYAQVSDEDREPMLVIGKVPKQHSSVERIQR